MKLLLSILLLSAITCQGQLTTTTTHAPSWSSTLSGGIKTDTIDIEKPALTLSGNGTITALDTSYKAGNSYADNKCAYMLTQIEQEIQYWQIAQKKAWKIYTGNGKNKFAGLSEYLYAITLFQYWRGVSDGMQAALYTACDGYNFQYELKTKPNKKQ